MSCKTNTKAFDIKKERIRKLDGIGILVMFGLRKKDAMKFITTFHNGIKRDTFALARLKEASIQSKARQGMSQPERPLYGKGDREKKKSYMNMLRIRKTKNGWQVFPSWGKHHKANLQLRQLLKIHEIGVTIKRGDTMIRIPARPAWRLAKEKFIQELKRESEFRNIKKAIIEYINTGKSEYFLKQIRIYKNDFKESME
jgi:hypothetical protein